VKMRAVYNSVAAMTRMKIRAVFAPAYTAA
jgi:hypothetical protein